MRQFLAIIANYWGDARINTSIKVFIALSGVVAPAWLSLHHDAIIPLVLGVIAAALSETDDNLRGKAQSFILLFICATIASFTTQILFNYPILFAIGFFVFSMSFIMLGAIGTRYASISFASILLSIYTMMGYETSPHFLFQPLLLLTGITWYALVALFWQWIWPLYPVQNSVARTLTQLGDYFNVKSKLFIPLPNTNLQNTRLNVAKQNAHLVAALEKAKTTLLHHADKTASKKYKYLLKTFFLVQDIHERGSSSHLSYETMANTFPRSDIMFRFQQIIDLQGKACSNLAQHISRGVPYIHSLTLNQAIDEAQISLQHLKDQQNSAWETYLPHLDYLMHNVKKIESRLIRLATQDTDVKAQSELADNEATHIQQMWQRVRSQLTLKSPLFRHALRLSVALCAGYIFIQTFDINNGYWIMLTTLFVCRPSFSSTRIVLIQRIIGTLIGLLLGSLLLSLFSDLQSQIIFMVFAGVLFFATRKHNYSIATMAITLLVLFCFNQSGHGFDVILPRLGDTLLGCLIAVIVSNYFFPDWASLHQKEIMQQAVKSNQDYLAQVIAQYRLGKHDNLNYRIARRQAHAKDAELSQLLSNIELEPERYKKGLTHSYRFLTLNHTLLNYISALGAHRQQLKSDADYTIIKHKYGEIHQTLQSVQGLISGEKQNLIIEQETKDIRLHTKSASMLFKQLQVILHVSEKLQAHTQNI